MATSRLLVRNIGPTSTPDDLRKLFGKYGNVTDAHIPHSLNSRGQRFAFIEFENARDAEAALDVLNNTTIEGYVTIKTAFISTKVRYQVSICRSP